MTKTPKYQSCSRIRPLLPHQQAVLWSRQSQKGVTLIELMVGIAIGLLTVAVAIGALMVSRGVSGTISDASQLQQQASYAFRVIGQQLRQSGSIRLNMAPKSAASTVDAADPVAFEAAYINPANPSDSFFPKTDSISGQDTPVQLVTGYRNYVESVYTSASDTSQFRNCLGENGTDAIVLSVFEYDNVKFELTCAGNPPLPPLPPTPPAPLLPPPPTLNRQPLIQNVADFQIRYLSQTGGNTGDPKIQYINAATAAADWTQVFGVEVCIVIFGTEVIDVPAGSVYKGCDGANINFSSSGSLPAQRKNRLHMTFKKVYQIRSQGLANIAS